MSETGGLSGLADYVDSVSDLIRVIPEAIERARVDGWHKGHDAACPQGRVCSAHQPPAPERTTTAQTPEYGPEQGLGATQTPGLVSGVTEGLQGREAAKWEHVTHGTCPQCGEWKFIGHGPLCGDCFAAANADPAPERRTEAQRAEGK